MLSTTVTPAELRTNVLAFHLILTLNDFFAIRPHPDLSRPRPGGLFSKGPLWPWPIEGALAYADGAGQMMLIGWNEAGFVGLVFDHESPNSEAAGGAVSPTDYRPLQWFDTLPEGLAPLAALLASRMRNLTTAGFYSEGEGPVLVSTRDVDDTHGWFGLLDGAPGAEVHGLSPQQVALCFEVAREVGSSRRRLSQAERELLLAAPAKKSRRDAAASPLDPAVLAAALERVGVDWADAD
jgi:hypothetical protein